VSGQTSVLVVELLASWKSGDKAALQQLVPLLYAELREVARQHLRQERSGHTLESRALVHEAYLRLVDQGPAFMENRSHFIGIASRLMRQVLVDHARRQRAAKRDGGFRMELDAALDVPSRQDIDIIALDDALNSLAALDERQSQIVEMRFFGGLSIEDTARVIGLSPATVKREWVTARAWLTRELGEASTT
jgi:RNA polymerase sigma factor (TIGR02999 family)